MNAVITSGMMNNKPKPMSIHRQEKIKPKTGTEDLESFWNNFAPRPLADRLKSIRLVAKTPLFAADIADVITTRFMIPAAAGRPASINS
ncbi:hypothetical protein D3C75_1285020 [compost metagenome]